MALTPKTLDAFEAATSPTTEYTVPALTTTRLTEIWMKNNAAATRILQIWIVNSGGSAGDDNELLLETLAPDDYFIIPLNTWLDTGDFIVVDCDGADVAVRISGIEEA